MTLGAFFDEMRDDLAPLAQDRDAERLAGDLYVIAKGYAVMHTKRRETRPMAQRVENSNRGKGCRRKRNLIFDGGEGACRYGVRWHHKIEADSDCEMRDFLRQDAIVRRVIIEIR
jgi:hypothetical protein